MTQLGKQLSVIGMVGERIHSLLSPQRASARADSATAIIGHRGAASELPENTVTSCRRAIQQGADGVEVDVCVTRDGHAVLWHNRDPNDAVGMLAKLGGLKEAFVTRAPDAGSPARRPVSRLDLAEFLSTHSYQKVGDVVLDGLDLDARGTVKVDVLPDLYRWLECEPRARRVMLDVKLSAEEIELTRPLLEELERLSSQQGDRRSCRVQLLTTELEIFVELAKEIPRYPALRHCEPVADFELPGVLERAREIEARHVGIGLPPTRTWRAVRDEIEQVLDARSRGDVETVLVWTLNDEDMLKDAIGLGVNAILTDDVPLARRLAAERGASV